MISTASSNHDATLERIHAMRAQEDATNTTYNYLQCSSCNTEDINESTRKSMIVWCQQVASALGLHAETVIIATSYFDRYLSSGKGKSKAALQNKFKFQLAAITSFYLAVKLYEPVELDVETLAKLCKGYYAESKILAMETDMLFALDFRVSTPSPMDFARHFLQLLPSEVQEESGTSKGLLDETQRLVDYTCKDFYFTFCKPSVVGAACLSSVLTSCTTDACLSSTQRQTFWLQLAKVTDLIDVMEAQKKLLGSGAVKKLTIAVVAEKKQSSIVSRVATFAAKRNKQMDSSQSSKKNTVSSPVCVTQAARQA